MRLGTVLRVEARHHHATLASWDLQHGSLINQVLLDRLIAKVEGKPGDTIVFSADTPKIVADSLANVRLSAAKLLNLIDEKLIKLAWVTEFPLVEYDEEAKRHTAMHQIGRAHV